MTVQSTRLHAVTTRSALLALVISVLWGANIVALKLGMQAIPPFWSAFWRMLISLPVIALWARMEGVRLLPRDDEWKAFAVLGVLFFCQISLLNTGTYLTSAAYAAVLLNSHPIFTSLFSHHFTPGDRLSPARVTGLVVAFAGISLLFLGKPEARLAPQPLLGNLILTLSACVVGVRAVVTKRVTEASDVTRLLLWMLVFSLPLFLACALLFEPMLIGPLTWEIITALLYQSIVVAGFCFVFWTRLLRDHSPGVISMFAFPTPIFGMLFSAILFSERLAPLLIVGVAAVVAGILIVARASARENAVKERAQEEEMSEVV
jgi:drug/metabolite transporter (DMT)-like permease